MHVGVDKARGRIEAMRVYDGSRFADAVLGRMAL